MKLLKTMYAELQQACKFSGKTRKFPTINGQNQLFALSEYLNILCNSPTLQQPIYDQYNSAKSIYVMTMNVPVIQSKDVICVELLQD